MRNLVTELQSVGIRVPENIDGRNGGAGPAEGRAFLIEQVPVNIPISGDYVKLSPFSLKRSGAGYLLQKGKEEIGPIGIVAEPQFYEHSTAQGISYRKIALLHGNDCLATTVLQRCVHWRTSNQCAFCATEATADNGNTIEKKTPGQLAEVARAARDRDGVTHMVLTSGTGNPPGSELSYLANCVTAIKSAANIPLHVQFAPPAESGLLDELKDAGTDTVGIHIESFDRETLKRWAPAKARIGRGCYEDTWKRAVALFGENQVSSFLIVGLGESPESIVWGSEYLADLGVYPFVVPLRPTQGSRMKDQVPPDSDTMKRIYEAVAGILSRKGLSARKSKAGCVRCGACSALSSYEKKPSRLLCHSARNDWEKKQAFEIRNEVFVTEQGLFADSDRDAIDEVCLHLVVRSDQDVVGTVRVFRGSNGAGHWVGGRLAVRKEYRTTRAGMLLVKEAMKRVKKKGCNHFSARIQEKNVRFFTRLGWKPIGPLEYYCGRPHVLMQADLNLVPND